MGVTVSRHRIAIYLLVLMVFFFTEAKAQIPPKISATKDAIEEGEKVYLKRCSFCHGKEGDGNGEIAEYLYPRPRDFTACSYKFRITASGELPTDEDLFRIISDGVPGTAMPTWKGALTDKEIWQVALYIKTFCADFTDPDFDPYKAIVKNTKEIPLTPETIAKGKEVYDKAKCWECHGQEGRADGPSAPTQKDDLGIPLLPADLTRGWKYKGGTSVTDIFTRFSTGLNGTPMPSYTETLSEEERWYISHYVKSLIKEEKAEAEVVLKAKFVEGPLPENPDDPLWKESMALEVRLTGQVITRPRWQIPSVELVTVRALFNDKEIAFLLEWDDATKNVTHKETREIEEDMKDTYPRINFEEREETLRDTVAIQFPISIPKGIEIPHFFLGSSGKSVNLWEWKSDWQEAGKKPVEELNAAGYKNPATSQPPESQSLMGKGIWKDGQWKVVMKRPLVTEDKAKDIQLERGKLIPIALNARDGGNGEKGLKMSISSWYYLVLEPPIPTTVYTWPVVTIFLAAGFELLLIRWAKNR